MNDIEQRLRDALQAKAAEAVPDPATWERVDRRLRLQRLYLWAGTGAAAVAAVVALILVVPGLLRGDRIILDPTPPVISQPQPDLGSIFDTTALDPVNFPGPATGYVFTDGESTAAINLETDEMVGLPFVGCAESYPDCYSYGPIVLPDVAMSPLPKSDLNGVILQMGFERCHEATIFQNAEDGHSYGTISEGCATSVVVSPDGELAAVGLEGSDEIEIVPMSLLRPSTSAAPIELGLDDSLVAIEVNDWFEDDAGNWYLLVSATRRPSATGRRVAFAVPLTNDRATPTVDGAPIPLEDTEGWSTIAVDGGYALQARYAIADGEEAPEEMRVSRLGTEHAVQVPDEVLNSARSNPAQPWLAAHDLSVMVGDGLTTAWTTIYGGSLPEQFRGDFGVTENGFSPLVKRDEAILDADFYVIGQEAQPVDEPFPGSEPPTPPPPTETTVPTKTVKVFFSPQSDSENDCSLVTGFNREVEGEGVLRGALTELLKGPNAQERADGYISLFSDKTAGMLNDVKITDGVARVDLDGEMRTVLNNASTSCGSENFLAALDSTVLQFNTVSEVIYSFDGNVSAFYDFVQRPAPTVAGGDVPPIVTKTAEDIRLAAGDGNLDRLRELITIGEDFTCFPGPSGRACVDYWEDQTTQGADPLGTLQELLLGTPEKQSTADRWVYKGEDTNPQAEGGPSGPQVGIDSDGTWRFYVTPEG